MQRGMPAMVCGANHCMSGEGSVHARQSCAGVALTRRSSTRSSMGSKGVPEPASDIIAVFLFLDVGKKRIEAGKPCFPEWALLPRPTFGGLRRFGPEPAAPHAAVLAGFNPSARLEHLQVLQETGQGHRMRRGQLGDGCGAGRKAGDHRPAGGIGKPGDDRTKVSHMAICWRDAACAEISILLAIYPGGICCGRWRRGGRCPVRVKLAHASAGAGEGLPLRRSRQAVYGDPFERGQPRNAPVERGCEAERG